MPEDLRTVVGRIMAYVEQQFQLAKKAAEAEEYETLEFLLGNIGNAVVTLRSAINSQLRILKRQG